MSDGSLEERFATALAVFNRAVDTVDGSFLTKADPVSGEQWDLAHVLGHVSEMLEFWMVEVLRVLARGPDEPFGRLKASPERLERIERSARRGLDELRREIDSRASATIDLCHILTPEQLQCRGTHPKFGVMTVEAVVMEFGVEHLLEHAQQLSFVDSGADRSMAPRRLEDSGGLE
ncbi:MAG: DinB family protein [Ferrimicrobium sp.]|jgi:hypothetical protein|uniref:DinB family protein n=1 Tax=Ferrimicrobium acidiphilum TaxID=121039 RepID=A0ABV3Y079_9ACTN|nr:DinB family protein [Ferrimicrobium sp.]